MRSSHSDMRKVLAGLEQIAWLDNGEQQLFFGSLREALRDLVHWDEFRRREARYFFEQGLHKYACAVCDLDPYGVFRLLQAGGWVERRQGW